MLKLLCRYSLAAPGRVFPAIIKLKSSQLRDVMTMTPYYSSWWSRTWVVVVVTVVSSLLFVLGAISAFTITAES